MQLLKTVEQARTFVRQLRHNRSSVGLVPTMGALHEGHYSLVRAGVRQCDFTIATIFVNPTQFAPGEDLGKYPRTLQADLDGLRRAGAAAVFIPDAELIYPPGFSTFVRPPSVADRLEAHSRPTHFQGVATVVLKLFQILPATHSFFGQKDFQQLRVIEAMVRDLNVEIEVIGCPIVRENDGLAMSSRNRYLLGSQRQRALQLSMALTKAEEAFCEGETRTTALESLMHSVLIDPEGESGVDSVDYAKVVDSITLEPIEQIQRQAVALVAANVGTTRLIDNRILNPTPPESLQSTTSAKQPKIVTNPVTNHFPTD